MFLMMILSLRTLNKASRLVETEYAHEKGSIFVRSTIVLVGEGRKRQQMEHLITFMWKIF